MEIIVAHVINAELCTNCTACVSECPVEAISAGDTAHVIDADGCVDCGACVGACPVEAISAG